MNKDKNNETTPQETNPNEITPTSINNDKQENLSLSQQQYEEILNNLKNELGIKIKDELHKYFADNKENINNLPIKENPKETSKEEVKEKNYDF